MRRIHRAIIVSLVMLLATCAFSSAADKKTPPPSAPTDQPSQKDAIVDRIFYQEAKLAETMQKFTPLVETYIQNLKPDADLGQVPANDAYFLGRLVLNEKGINDKRYLKSTGLKTRVLDRLNSFYRMNYLPLGFMQLVLLNNKFDREHYDLRFLRAQFLGEVRTLVFDVVAKPHTKDTHFVGRIWVEDRDYNIVRFNGTYEPSRASFFFHFDTWRENLQPGVWLPAYVYTEETDKRYMLIRKLTMKGQTRLWGYDRKHSGLDDELTSVQVDPEDAVSDHSDKAANQYSPVQSQHLWERESEDNVLDRLERAGLIAPDGPLSTVLQTVANNLQVTNNLNIAPAVRCRVLLTAPLESFTVGHTIVISRGLLDVLPDEASLAMVVAHELAHIALGHKVDTKYAFGDRMLFPDEQSFRDISISRSHEEEEQADKKGLELLSNSPYKDKLQNAALFLRALHDYSQDLHWLITPHFGNSLAGGNTSRMESLLQSAPQLDKKDTKQLAALPLGSRVHLDPWNDRVELKTLAPVALESSRDKMPFQVTPVFPNLVRIDAGEVKSAGVVEQHK